MFDLSHDTVLYENDCIPGEDFHILGGLFKAVLSVTRQWVGRQDAKRFLIRVISNICYVRHKVEKLHRLHIAFYDGPLLDATQYTKTWSCAKGLFYSLMAKECSLSRQLWFNDLFPKFFQTCTHLARMRLSDPPECECTSSEKEARAKSSLSSLIKEQVLFFALPIIRDHHFHFQWCVEDQAHVQQHLCQRRHSVMCSPSYNLWHMRVEELC